MKPDSYNWEGHDHSECKKTTAKAKAYDPDVRRYTLHDFKSKRYVEAVTGTEAQAELRCIEISRAWGGKHSFFYKLA